jgi:protoporphyrinogen oxidase
VSRLEQRKNFVVLGAGPAGLSAAWTLARAGHRVVVFEKQPFCGGQSLTFEQDGFRYDLGPHNIHSRRPDIIEFLKGRLGDELWEHDLQAQIYFRGRRVNYPLVGIQVLRSLPLRTSAACAASFLGRRAQALVNPALNDDGTYETWVVNRFGRRFYDIFFGPYTQKTWGFPPSELSDIVAKKRIAIRSLGELMASILFQREKYHPENPRLIRNLYPRRGIGTIAEFFRRELFDKGGELHLDCAVRRLDLSARGIVRLEYRQNGREGVLELASGDRPPEWMVLSTLPLNELILMIEGPVPEGVRAAGRDLDFTAEVFLYLNLKQAGGFGVPLLYFSETEFPFNRVYDVGLFSRAMVPPGRNALCLEITCTQGDPVWTTDAATLFERCLVPLERHGLLHRNQVEDFHLRRLPQAYPRFRVGYQQKLRTIFDYVRSVPNLRTFGRQGLFSYANVDDAIWMGFRVGDELMKDGGRPLRLKDLLPDYIDV